MAEEGGRVVSSMSYRGYHVVFSSAMLMMFGTMGMWSMTRLQPKLMADLGWNAATISGALTLNLILMSLMGPVVGYLIDKITPRWTALIGSILTGAAICLLATAREIWQFYLFYGFILSVGLVLSYTLEGSFSKSCRVAPKVIDLIEKTNTEHEQFGRLTNVYSTLIAQYGMSLGAMGRFAEGERVIKKGLSFARSIDNLISLAFVEMSYSSLCWCSFLFPPCCSRCIHSSEP